MAFADWCRDNRAIDTFCELGVCVMNEFKIGENAFKKHILGLEKLLNK